MSNSSKINVLVIGATGKQGSPVCKQLIEAGSFNVFGTTRNVSKDTKLSKLGATAVAFQFGDKASIENALKTSNAQYVYFLTDFFAAAKGKKQIEIDHGKMIIDACKSYGVKHIVFSSVIHADICPDKVLHFKSKLEIEYYLKKSGVVSYSILRPVAFIENFDDPANWNPLKKGSVGGLWLESAAVDYISVQDIARGAVLMFQNPAEWNGRTLNCSSCRVTGTELAAALSKASGVPCKYSIGVPFFMQWLMMADLYYMSRFFESEQYKAVDTKSEFLKLFPEAMGPLEFFKMKGQWSNGEKFNPST